MRWVVVTAKYRSLRQAAKALHIRESSLSRRLRDLELHLGTELFERTSNGTKLTAAGDEFVGIAKHILAETDLAFARMSARGRGESGTLVVGICMALSVGSLRATLAEFDRRHSEVVVHGVDGSRSRLIAELSSGGIDLFLTSEGHAAWNEASLSLWTERVMVALPEGHPLSSSSFIRWRDLAGARILVNRRDPGPDYERMLQAQLGDRSSRTFIGHDVSLDRLLGFVAAGLGLTLVSEGATGIIHSGVAYRELHDDDAPALVRFAAYWKENNRNPALRPFLDLLRERYSDVAPSLLDD